MSFVREAEERYALRHAMKLAEQVRQKHSGFYSEAPRSRLILEVRSLAKVAAASGIRDPDMLTDLVTALFNPHPSCLSARQRETVASLLMNQSTDGDARCRAIRAHLGSEQS